MPPILDLIGIAIFALTGSLVAAKLRQTFVTMAFFALVTGVGGGSVRDLLIGAPVFWVHDPWVAPVCFGVAMLVWFSPQDWWKGQLFEWSDAMGLAGYGVLGTAKAIDYGVAPIPAILMGIITGCVGGIIRDVVAGRPSIIMRPELYVPAAALSATVCAAGYMLNMGDAIIWPIAGLSGFALRGAAIQWGLSIPSYGKRNT